MSPMQPEDNPPVGGGSQVSSNKLKAIIVVSSAVFAAFLYGMSLARSSSNWIVPSPQIATQSYAKFASSVKEDHAGDASRNIEENFTNVMLTSEFANDDIRRDIVQALEDAGLGSKTESSMTILMLKNNVFNVCKKSEPFVLTSCRTSWKKVCVIVCDKQYYNVSDIVLINIFYSSESTFPTWRPKYQKWVAYDMEAPPQSTWLTTRNNNRYKNAFNFSSFFSKDSAVPFSGGNQRYINIDKYTEIMKSKKDFSKGKKRPVVWIVSHCETQSKRESYVQELQKYIDVDIYGGCGKKLCTERNKIMPTCVQDVLNDYYFYLSFESSLCDDYVTEKLWKVLSDQVTVLPVVMGLANYSQLLPENTYLSVFDYSSPKVLAQEMHKMITNASLFNQYMIQKMALKQVASEGFLCNVCDYAHDHRKEIQTMEDITKFWSVSRKCRKPEELIPGPFWAEFEGKKLNKE